MGKDFMYFFKPFLGQGGSCERRKWRETVFPPYCYRFDQAFVTPIILSTCLGCIELKDGTTQNSNQWNTTTSQANIHIREDLSNFTRKMSTGYSRSLKVTPTLGNLVVAGHTSLE